VSLLVGIGVNGGGYVERLDAEYRAQAGDRPPERHARLRLADLLDEANLMRCLFAYAVDPEPRPDNPLR
jgi:hypothetical protein